MLTLQWRGQVLGELHKPILIKLNQDFQRGKTAKDDFIKNLRDLRASLEESVRCLEFEPEGTKEWKTMLSSKKAIAEIKDVILFADYL